MAENEVSVKNDQREMVNAINLDGSSILMMYHSVNHCGSRKHKLRTQIMIWQERITQV